MRCANALDAGGRNAYVAGVIPNLADISAFVSVVVVDVVLAGDNAIVVGMAAAGLPAAQRRRVIVLGTAAATVLRILCALLTMKLLEVIGLTLAGGVLLLWVAWKLFRELRAHKPAPRPAVPSGRPCEETRLGRKSVRRALGQIILADVSMSLDNVLALAGTARAHPLVLVFGLALSVALMGVASNYVARLLGRYFWISWIGLAIVTIVALRMLWQGSAEVLREAAAGAWPLLV
ncbi:MAG TPA: YjbE family putative metal transport protein [Stellaceae bacterium]|nr:YjbE family putative metal transport protein [Stellaceae bacterium]